MKISENSIITGEGFNDYELSHTETEGNSKDGWVFTLTNHYDPVMTHVSVIKRWQDSKNAYHLRPNHLTIVLKADGVAVQTHSMTDAEADANASTSKYDVWKHTFDDLPKYNNGVEIQYTVEEQLTDDDAYLYKNSRSSVSADSGGYKTFTFTNRNKTATVTLQKNNERGNLINGAIFELTFADGTPLTLSEIYPGRYSFSPGSTSNNNRITLSSGTAEISDLPPNAVIIAKEITAPNNYSAYANEIYIDVMQSIKDNGITDNSSGVYEIPTVTVNNYKTVMPATGSVGDYAIYFFAGLSLIGSFLFYKKRRKDDEV